jgi:dTDP-4-dehydrorhamnose reductase
VNADLSGGVSTDRSARPILLFGGSGQVGRQLMLTLAPLGTLVAPTRAEADLTRPGELRDVIERIRPSAIVNAAALTNVDQAERDPALARAVNEIAPGVMAQAARDLGALLVHYSTDYVFDGETSKPYDETATPNPINAYGATKLAGECRVADADGPHLIIRTSWVYSATGAGFVASLLRDLPGKPTLRVVADQIGSPTWSRSLARATAELVAAAMDNGHPVLAPKDYGVYHLGGEGSGSRMDIAERLLEVIDMRGRPRPTIIPVSSVEFGAPAPRPHYSALSNTRTERRFGVTLDPWRAELQRMVATAGR